MADRIGVINKGEIILVEEKAELMRKLGKKQLTLQLQAAARRACPTRSPRYELDARRRTARELVYTYDTQGERTGIAALLRDLDERRHRLQGPADRRRARSRTSSSAW